MFSNVIKLNVSVHASFVQVSRRIFWVPVVMQLILQLIMIKRSDRCHQGTFSERSEKLWTNKSVNRTFVKSIWSLMLSKRQHKRYLTMFMKRCCVFFLFFFSLNFVELLLVSERPDNF